MYTAKKYYTLLMEAMFLRNVGSYKSHMDNIPKTAFFNLNVNFAGRLTNCDK
jgi:hypothetical protein